MDRSSTIKKLKNFSSFFSFLNKNFVLLVTSEVDKMNFSSYDEYYKYALNEMKKMIREELNKQYKENSNTFFPSLLKFKGGIFVDSYSRLKLLSVVIKSLDTEIDEETYNMLISKHFNLRELLEGCSLNDEEMYENFIREYPGLKNLFDTYLKFSLKNGNKSSDFKSKEEILSYDEVKELYRRMATGDITAKEILVKKNERLVKSIAFNFYRSGRSESFDYDDLVQCGMIGLIEAIDRYNPDKEKSFSTYASLWIKGIIFREINRTGSMVKIPRQLKDKNRKIVHEIEDMKRRFGRSLSDAEIQEKLNLKKSDLVSFYKFLAFSQMISIYKKVNEECESEIVDFIPAEENVMESVINDIMSERLINILKNSLNYKEYTVIKHRFGLEGTRAKKLQEIGNIMGFSRERARQIENKALKKIRSSSDFYTLIMSNENKILFDKICSVCDDKDLITYIVYRTGMIGSKALTKEEVVRVILLDVTKLESLESLARNILENNKEFDQLLLKFKSNNVKDANSNLNYKEKKTNARSFITILKELYTDSEIEQIIAGLTDKQREYLTLRYGENFDTVNNDLDQELKIRIGVVVNLIKRNAALTLAKENKHSEVTEILSSSKVNNENKLMKKKNL